MKGLRLYDTLTVSHSGNTISGRIVKFKGDWLQVYQPDKNKNVWIPINAILKEK